MTGSLEAWTLVEALPIPVLVLDSNQLVVAANADGVATFLRERSGILGRNFKDVAVETWRTALAHSLDRVMRTASRSLSRAMSPQRMRRRTRRARV